MILLTLKNDECVFAGGWRRRGVIIYLGFAFILTCLVFKFGEAKEADILDASLCCDAAERILARSATDWVTV